jgi:hypothetical protein
MASDNAHNGPQLEIRVPRAPLVKPYYQPQCPTPSRCSLDHGPNSPPQRAIAHQPLCRYCSTTNQPSTNPTGLFVSHPSACERKPTSMNPAIMPSAASATKMTSGIVARGFPARMHDNSDRCSSAEDSGHSDSSERESCSQSPGIPTLIRPSIINTPCAEPKTQRPNLYSHLNPGLTITSSPVLDWSRENAACASPSYPTKGEIVKYTFLFVLALVVARGQPAYLCSPTTTLPQPLKVWSAIFPAQSRTTNPLPPISIWNAPSPVPNKVHP